METLFVSVPDEAIFARAGKEEIASSPSAVKSTADASSQRQTQTSVIASLGKRHALRRFPERGNLLAGKGTCFQAILEIATVVGMTKNVIPTTSQ